MFKIIAPLAFATVVLAPLAASATECTSAPKDQWKSEDAIKTTATDMGYTVRRVKVEDGCYEVYGIDKDGNKVEALFDPVSGNMVSDKDSD
jgi:hypothetical protein